MTTEIEALLALEPARARGELGDREAAGLVDVERQVLHLDRHVLDLLEVALGDVAAADRVARGCRSARQMMRVASCSADISSEKKPTMPPLTRLVVAVGLHLAA